MESLWDQPYGSTNSLVCLGTTTAALVNILCAHLLIKRETLNQTSLVNENGKKFPYFCELNAVLERFNQSEYLEIVLITGVKTNLKNAQAKLCGNIQNIVRNVKFPSEYFQRTSQMLNESDFFAVCCSAR
ncbi:hypothetical protein WA026_016047 [Henosepilachna vigintioctopunctata]|uniref:Uncharacterized protein n=1 Tax=Henosepilachna vigintioctopunctata TaxID=420089 RepID=A0AAW1UAS0_9CUCU